MASIAYFASFDLSVGWKKVTRRLLNLRISAIQTFPQVTLQLHSVFNHNVSNERKGEPSHQWM